MGSEQLYCRGQQFDPRDWHVAAVEPSYQVLSNLTTRVQHYRLTAKDPSERSTLRDLLELRRNNQSDCWVSLLGYCVDESPGYCAVAFPFEVYTESIPQLLPRVRSFEEGSAVEHLLTLLAGFSELRRFCGCEFNVSERMVGFNKANQLKLWCSQNFAENCPQSRRAMSLAKEEAEHSMVLAIVEMVASRLPLHKLPDKLAASLVEEQDKYLKLESSRRIVQSYIECRDRLNAKVFIRPLKISSSSQSVLAPETSFKTLPLRHQERIPGVLKASPTQAYAGMGNSKARSMSNSSYQSLYATKEGGVSGGTLQTEVPFIERLRWLEQPDNRR